MMNESVYFYDEKQLVTPISQVVDVFQLGSWIPALSLLCALLARLSGDIGAEVPREPGR